MQMEVDIDASIPSLKKSGTMHAFRFISKIGKVTYDALRFDGDNTVKKEVIARFLAAESESPTRNVGINEQNYKFKFKGLQTKDARQVYVLELNPKRKEVGLFKGEVWLDPDTHLPVREHGKLVKNPSIFLKKVEFVRDYQIKDGVAMPSRFTSYADTRIVGRTEVNINYSNYLKTDPPTVAAEPAEGPIVR